MPTVALTALARRLGLPYPILLTLGGLVLGFVPNLPDVELEPELVFLLFLPPVLFAAAYATSWRDFWANRRPILLLAVGLVLATTGTVAAVAHAIVPGLPWAVAFVLGAVVSPPDAVATTAIVQRLDVPRRIVTILEGESLVNDATALVALNFAVVAAVTGTFSLGAAAIRFVVVALGGIAAGVLVGTILVWLLGRLHDPVVGIALTLIGAIAAYLPAERLGVSGVLATVTAGLLLGRRSSASLDPTGRLAGAAVWGFVVFLINGLAFILIGLQLPSIVDGLAGLPVGAVITAAAAVCLAAIAVRIRGIFPATYLPRRPIPGLAARDPAPPGRRRRSSPGRGCGTSSRSPPLCRCPASRPAAISSPSATSSCSSPSASSWRRWSAKG